MNWDETAKGEHCIKLGAESEPYPIVLSGKQDGKSWAWLGDFSRILRLGGLEWQSEPGSQQGQFVAPDGTVEAYVARMDDTPEITDLATIRGQVAELQAAADTDDFRDWLADEIKLD